MELEPLHLKDLKYSLFAKRRFLPIFLATLLGAFNDNLLRSGLVVLIAYSAAQGIRLPVKPEILVTICSALLVMPMMLFSSIAGALADKYEKSRLVSIAKFAEILIMLAALHGFATNNIYLLMAMLFISGTHTTFYSPIKFSILPDHLSPGELLAGNGFMAAGSYLAILSGMIAGGLLVMLPDNVIGHTAVCIAIVGFAASLFIPKSRISHPGMRVNFNLWTGARDIIAYAARDRTILLCTLALSWFLLIGSVYLGQFANYAQSVVHADNEVYTLFLALFTVGIALGSLLTDTLLKGEISARLTPFACLGISVFTFAMVLTTPEGAQGDMLGVSDFLSKPAHWPALVSMLLTAMCGGVYIVPLYALLQSRSHSEYRSRVMAASNMSDSVFMTVAAIICAILLSVGLHILDLFLLLATLNLGVAWVARKIVK